MHLLKYSSLIAIFSYISVTVVHAEEDVISLPTITVMADAELREETEIVPFLEDKQVRQSLQHQIYKIENNIQNTPVKENTGVMVHLPPQAAEPDMAQVSPVLQRYILSVADGFQSSDPTNGAFKILEPLNINRNNIDGFRDGSLKINMEDALRLQQQIRDGLGGK